MMVSVGFYHKFWQFMLTISIMAGIRILLLFIFLIIVDAIFSRINIVLGL
jgi:hypothetical protein